MNNSVTDLEIDVPVQFYIQVEHGPPNNNFMEKLSNQAKLFSSNSTQIYNIEVAPYALMTAKT